MKGANDRLVLGDWNAVCYECGFKKKASQMLKHWQGYYVCSSCFEPRHPQDFVRGVPDSQTPPWTQPEPPASFIPLCTPNTRSAYPGYAGPGCATPGYVSPAFDPDVETI